jgi:hypothetical protein
MELKKGKQFVTKHVNDVPIWQFGTPPYYEPLEEWENSINNIVIFYDGLVNHKFCIPQNCLKDCKYFDTRFHPII